MRYHLTGRFIECCNCKIVCPCWVDDTPTEDHCAGFFAWTFDEDCQIDGYDVSHRHVVVVTVHSDRSRGGSSESVIFVDDRLDDVPAATLAAAFAMDDPERTDPLADLRTVLGDPVARTSARIRIDEVTDDDSGHRRWGKRRRRTRRPGPPRDGYCVRVSVPSANDAEDEPLVAATLYPEMFDQSAIPLTLAATALDKEMGSHQGVTAHRTETLLLRVAALAGAGTELQGRSGMVGQFRYLHPSAAFDRPTEARARERGRGAESDDHSEVGVGAGVGMNVEPA